MPTELQLGKCMQVWTSKVAASLQGKYVRNGTPNGGPAYNHDYQANLPVVVAVSFQVSGVYFIPKGAGMSNNRWDIAQDQIWQAQIFIWFICLISTQTKTSVGLLYTTGVFFNNELSERFQFLKGSCTNQKCLGHLDTVNRMKMFLVFSPLWLSPPPKSVIAKVTVARFFCLLKNCQ